MANGKMVPGPLAMSAPSFDAKIMCGGRITCLISHLNSVADTVGWSELQSATKVGKKSFAAGEPAVIASAAMMTAAPV